MAATVAASLMASGLAAQELPLTHITPEHRSTPLPSASVQSIIQDRTGFIWLGLYSSGVTRYDGHSMESYGSADGLPDLTAREVLEDATGRLWVGTDAGLAVSDRPLTSYAPGERVRFVTRVGNVELSSGRIRRNCLVLDRDGWVWAATMAHELQRYRFGPRGFEAKTVVTGAADGDRHESAAAIVVRKDGTAWVAITNGALLVLAPQGETYQQAARFDGEDLAAITAFRDGSTALWLGAIDGEILRYDEKERTFLSVSPAHGSRSAYIDESSAGELWCASLGGGVVRFPAADPSAAQRYTRKHGLLSETVWGIAVDREGNQWFAQNGGISRLQANWRAHQAYSGSSNSTEAPYLPDSSVFASLPRQEPDDLLWVGTGAGLGVLDRDGQSDVLDVADGLFGNSVYSLAGDSRGRIWIGTLEGLNAVTFGSATLTPLRSSEVRPVHVFSRPAKLYAFQSASATTYACRIFPLRVTRSGGDVVESMWAAGSGGVAAYVDDEWFVLRMRAGLPAAGATNLVVDDDGFLWIATADSGVLRSEEPVTLDSLRAKIDRETREVRSPFVRPLWNRERGAPTNRIRNLLAIGSEVWIGTSHGISILDRAALKATASGVHAVDAVVGMATSPSGTIWVSYRDGLAEIDPKTRKVIRQVSKSDGLLDNESWAYDPVRVGSDGLVHFATPKGLSLYRPELDRPNLIIPPLVLRNVQMRRGNRGNNESLFEYAALTYANESGARYRTRLIGFDDDWSHVTTETKIRFTNLRAFLFDQRYRFEVLGSNDDGVWTRQPLRYAFNVSPPWWLRWWAVVAYAVVALLLLVLLARYRTRKLERRNRELKRLVEERTEEIQSQAAELETVDHIVQLVNREVELDRVLRSLLEQGMKLFPQAEKGAVIVNDQETGNYHLAIAAGYEEELYRSLSLTADEAMRRYAGGEQLHENVYIVRDFEDLAGEQKLRAFPRPKAMLTMAVTFGGRVEAFVVFDNFTDPDAFDSSDLRKLSRYREHATSAIAKARIVRELQIKSAEAQQANEAKSRFLASMSHELRTPLNSIIGFSELLSERLERDISPKHLNFLSVILASGQHLLAIINDILDLSKIEAGKMEIVPETCSVRAAIESVCLAMRGQSGKEGIFFDIDIAEDVPAVETDAGKLRQILFNLLSNAVKFSPERSSVRVVARRIDDPAEVRISVVDRGIGIAADDLETIFEEFRQVENPLHRQSSGTGLGLALVRRLVRLIGGTITVESVPGKGSTFSFTVPLGRSGGLSAGAPNEAAATG